VDSEKQTPKRGDDMNKDKVPTLAKLADSLAKLEALKKRDIANARFAFRQAQNRPWFKGGKYWRNVNE